MIFFFKRLFVYNRQAVQQCDESQLVSHQGVVAQYFFQDQINVSLIGSLHIALYPSHTQT